MSYDSPKVLLIEEDPTLAEVTGFRLELLGFRVSTAASAEGALTAVGRELPDVIILDLTLPDMDGVELTDRLSNDERTSVVPILVLSSNSDLNDVERAYAAGAKDYLVIPYNPTLLEEKLEGLLQGIGKAL
jgi:DNA-binding response OmpR family regulator